MSNHRLRMKAPKALISCADYWRSMNASERRAILFGAAVLTPLILVFGVWLPVSDRVAALENRLTERELQLANMRALLSTTGRLAANPSESPATTRPQTVDLPARIEAQLRNALPTFKGSVRAVEGGFELTLESGGFDALMQWISEQARRDAFFVLEAQLSPVMKSPGLVGGRIRFIQGGA